MSMRALLLLTLCCLAAGACAPRDTDPTPDAGTPDAGTPDAGPPDAGPPGTSFPKDDASWPTVSPAAAGWDEAKLEEALAFAGTRSTRALVIVQDGRILAERYWSADATYTRDIASAQKSLVSVLVGIAVDRGLLSLDDTATQHLGAGWSNASADAEARVTLRHLLTMTSGLSLGLQVQAEPGTQWLYNNDAYHRLRLVLEARTGQGIQALSQAWLFGPLGATRSNWYARTFMTDSKGLPLWGLTMSARDLARFGLLVLAEGTWDGTPVVSSAYLADATRPSQALNPGYGRLFWLNGQAFTLVPLATRVEGPLVPSAPADLVAGLGADDQKVYVSRSLRLVVTRLGAQAGSSSADALSSFDEELWARLMAARK